MRATETSSGHHLQAVVGFIFLRFWNCGCELWNFGLQSWKMLYRMWGFWIKLKFLSVTLFKCCDDNYPSLGGYSNHVALDHGSFCLY
jgi:hypothetical protein